MLDEGARGERGAVPADANKGPWQPLLRRLCKIDDLWNISEVIAGKSNNIRPPAIEQSKIRGVILDLQIDQPCRVAGAPCRLGNQLEAERLEPQEYPRIEERAGMDAEKSHENSLLAPVTPPGPGTGRGVRGWRQPSGSRLMSRPNTRR